jgi:hypothetical protein
MGTSLTTLTGVMKEVYDGKLRRQLNDEVVLLKRIVRNGGGSTISTNVGGKYCTFPIHVYRNTGIGARREGENLPKAGNQGTAPAQVKLKYEYGSVELTGQSIRLVDKDFQAFIAATDLEMNGLKTDLSKDLNRQIYGNSTGAIATVSTVGANTTATVTSGINVLQVQELVDVYVPATLVADGSPKATAVTITAVDSAAGTITVSPSVTWASGDVIVRNGNANREWTGLGAIVNNSGQLYGVDPAAYPIWKSVVDQGTPPGTLRPLSESAMIRNVHAVRTNGGKTSLLISSLGVQRAYWNLLVQARRFSNVKEFTGGYSGLVFTTDQGEVPMVADIDCPYNTLYGISEENVRVYRDADWDWMDYDGSMWDRVPGTVAGTIKDAYQATMFQYSELGTDRRNAHFVMKDITES